MPSRVKRDFGDSAKQQQKPANDRPSRREWPGDKFYRDVEDRTIFVNDIDGTAAHDVVSQLLYFDKIDPDKPITMIINSGGGTISAGLGIIGVMKTLRAPVHTVAFGDCESMASLLLAAGTKGHRSIYPGTRFMVHQPWWSKNFGRESDGAVLAADATNSRYRSERLYLHFIGLPPTKNNLKLIHQALETDTVMNTGQAHALGLADNIIGVPDERDFEHLDGERRRDLAERRDFMKLLNEIDHIEHDKVDMSSYQESEVGQRAIRALIDAREHQIAAPQARGRHRHPS
ncbi:MAG TPA: ATP-dependent Clp protease proteolytic subunit [Patescibacteria group bacterium]|jgi:ATP-dependent Clp protease protease subunit|nr:ATP-dependent Clp protease proteolytic subunit [Patescibacteria group bacterium]